MTTSLVTRRLTVAVSVLASTVMLVPQAQAAFPGRNGALLVTGVQAGAWGEGCGAGPPRLVGRVADDSPSCSSGVSAWLAGPGRHGVRLLWNARTPEDYIDDGGVSPDGRSVVLGISSSLGEIIVVPVHAGSRARELPWGGSAPTWTAGGRISFTGSDGSLFFTRPTGPRRGWEPDGWSIEGVRWSSTGRYAVIAPLRAIDEPTSRDMGLLVSDSTGRWDAGKGALGSDGFDWAPTGRSLVVTRSVKGRGRALYVVGLDGKITKRITTFVSDDDLAEPRWSPDGRLIAFRRGVTVHVTSARTQEPQGPAAWRTIMRDSKRLIDWQALPTRRGGR